MALFSAYIPHIRGNNQFIVKIRRYVDYMRASAPCSVGLCGAPPRAPRDIYGALPRAPVGIYGALPRAPVGICEALPRAPIVYGALPRTPLRTFFEKKVLRTPKNF